MFALTCRPLEKPAHTPGQTYDSSNGYTVRCLRRPWIPEAAPTVVAHFRWAKVGESDFPRIITPMKCYTGKSEVIFVTLKLSGFWGKTTGT